MVIDEPRLPGVHMLGGWQSPITLPEGADRACHLGLMLISMPRGVVEASSQASGSIGSPAMKAINPPPTSLASPEQLQAITLSYRSHPVRLTKPSARGHTSADPVKYAASGPVEQHGRDLRGADPQRSAIPANHPYRTCSVVEKR
jgi:hypothetical protein